MGEGGENKRYHHCCCRRCSYTNKRPSVKVKVKSRGSSQMGQMWAEEQKCAVQASSLVTSNKLVKVLLVRECPTCKGMSQ